MIFDQKNKVLLLLLLSLLAWFVTPRSAFAQSAVLHGVFYDGTALAASCAAANGAACGTISISGGYLALTGAPNNQAIGWRYYCRGTSTNSCGVVPTTGSVIHYFVKVSSCAAGYWTNTSTGMCDVVPTCEGGETYDSGTNMCIAAEPYQCGIGYYNDDGGTTVESCLPYGPQEEDCSRPLGYVGDDLICGDDADDCAATGGSYGQINGQNVCIPQGEDTPECEPGTFVFVPDGSSTFACVTPESNPPPGTGGTPIPPDFGDPEPPGEGGVDPDQTGTGPTETGPCDPTDQDYALCSGMSESVSESMIDNMVNQMDSKGTSLMSKLGTSFSDAVGDGQFDIGDPSGISDLTGTVLPSAGSCVDFSSGSFHGADFGIPCDRTAIVREILGYFFYVYTMFRLVIIARRRPV